MIRDVLLPIHIAAGTCGLILGPIAMFTAKRRGRHTRIGEVYFWVYVALVLAAFGVAATDWSQDWFLIPIGVFSFSFALLGYLSGKRRQRDWLQWHVAGQGGSYIAMTTALLVVNFGTGVLVAWFIPTIIGSPLIIYANRQIALGRRPKGRPDLSPRRPPAGSVGAASPT